jgi:hypothetical protein
MIHRTIEFVDRVDFSPVDSDTNVVDVESLMEIVEKLNEVIAYINSKEREKK